MSVAIVLVGPKGAGKSTLARMVERVYRAVLVPVEPIWIAHQASKPEGDASAWERAGWTAVAERTVAAAREHDVAVLETTGAAPWTEEMLAAIAAGVDRVVRVRVTSAPETCLSRVASRSREDHLDVALDRVAEINRVALATPIAVDATVDNGGAWDEVDRRVHLSAAVARAGVALRARPVVLETPRTRLRPFRPDDRPAFAALNADPEVMEHFPALLTAAESDALAARIEERTSALGFGLWALEIPGVTPFCGFVGLSIPTFDAPFMPCVEIGWRLARSAWGHGWAHEAAARVLAFGHEQLALPEIVSFAARTNVRSIRLMERLGLRPDPSRDFEHPKLPVGHRLRPHVFYSATR